MARGRSAPAGAAPPGDGGRSRTSSRTVPSCPSVARVAAEPCSHSTLYILANDSGSIAVIGLFSSITGEPGLGKVPHPALGEGDRGDLADAVDARSAGAIAAGMPCPSCLVLMIRLPVKERLTAWSIVAFVPAASTEMNATSPSPTVRASAVTSVRPGWRTEFSRARRPVMPRQLTISPMERPRAGMMR